MEFKLILDKKIKKKDYKIYVYIILCSIEHKPLLKDVMDSYYRENSDGSPLYFSLKSVSHVRVTTRVKGY